jgi:hypothetical protein
VALFEASTTICLGNGERARFWQDRWLDGACVEDVAPNLLPLVPPCKAKARSVKEGLSGLWLQDCGPDLTAEALAEFFILWQILVEVWLSPEREDDLLWAWTADGVYSSKLAYNAFFAGRPQVRAATQVWHSRVPYGCRFFAWLVSKYRCWTADRLERRVLLHPAASHFVIRSRRRFSTYCLCVWWLPKPLGSAAMAPGGRHGSPSVVGVEVLSQGYAT